MGRRSEYRRSKRINRILNIAIIIVTVLILFLGGNLAVNWFSSDQAAVDEQESSSGQSGDGQTIEEGDEEGSTAANDDGDSDNAASEEENNEDENSSEENDEEEQSEDEETEETEGDTVPTQQENPSPNDFTRGSQNWNEMESALYLATGLNESNSTLMWLGNGGSTTSARGVLLDNNTGTYYDVHLQWEDNVGWTVVSSSESATDPR